MSDIESDPLFKGCTRPAMMFGVPLVPLVVGSMFFIMAGVWFNLLIVLGIIPMVIIMRVLVANDDQMFRLLWLKFLFRVIFQNANGAFWKASAYNPLTLLKRK